MTLLDFQLVLGRHNIRPPHFASKVSYSASPQSFVALYYLAKNADFFEILNTLPFKGSCAATAMLFGKKSRRDFSAFCSPTLKDINKECHTPSIYRMFEVWHSLLYISNCLCLLVFLLLNDGIDDSHGSDVDDVTHAAFEVGEVDRLLQSHLNWANNFGIFSHRLNHLV